MKKLYMVSKAITIVALLVIVGLIYIKLRRNKGKQAQKPIAYSRPGSAHGIIFGKSKFSKLAYSPEDDEGSCAVFGGSGTGKTSALLIPTLKSWQGTAFVIDISGDITGNVPGEKIVYAPGKPDTVKFNVFAEVDTLPTEAKQNQALARLAHLLMPELKNATANSQYFQSGGRDIITAALIAFYHEGYDFCEICELILSKSYSELFKAIDETENDTAIMYINKFEGSNEQNISGCKENSDKAISLFVLDEDVRASVSRDGYTFSPESLEEQSVYISIPDHLLELYSPLLHIIVAQFLDYFSARPTDKTSNILFALDEFVSLGKLEIAPALRKLRKKRVRILVITQSMADLDELYGKESRMAMMNNFAFTAVLSARDVETQRYFADLIGQQDETKTSYTRDRGLLAAAGSKTISNERRYIIEPAELANLKDEIIVLYPGGYKRLMKNYYFKR